MNGGPGFFADAPFSNVVVVPLQRVAPGTTGPVQLGAFDCSGFQGARFSFFNNQNPNGTAYIQLLYFDDADTAQAFANTGTAAANAIVATRALLIVPGAQSCAQFTLGHPADFLVVQMQSVDVGNLDVSVAIAQRQNPNELWLPSTSVVLGTRLPDGVLSMGVTVAFPVGTTNIGGQSAQGAYAGPAHFWAAGPTAATQFTVFVQTRDPQNVYQTIFEGGADARGIINQDFVMPATNDIRIHAINTSGGAGVLSWTIVADHWRAG